MKNAKILSLAYTVAELEKMYDAAKRGLKLVNRLPLGQEGINHKSRVFSNMNKLRAAIKRAINYQLNSVDMYVDEYYSMKVWSDFSNLYRMTPTAMYNKAMYS